MTVGKIWYEATRAGAATGRCGTRSSSTRRRRGHSLQYLRMPQAARDTFGAGLVQREATKVVDLLQDAADDGGPPGDARRGDAGHRDARDARAARRPARPAGRRGGREPRAPAPLRRRPARDARPRGRRGRRATSARPARASPSAPPRRRLGGDQCAAPRAPARGDRQRADRRAAVPLHGGVRATRGRDARRRPDGTRRRYRPRAAHDAARRSSSATASSSSAGSGGVGKTTVAASVGALGRARGPADGRAHHRPRAPARDARSGSRRSATTRARSRADVFAAQGLDAAAPLAAMMLDQKGAWDALVERHAPPEARARILANPFYQHLSQTFAGSQEYMAIEQLCVLVESGALRPDRRRHAADAPRARLPRGAEADRRLPRPPRRALVRAAVLPRAAGRRSAP